MKSLRPAVQFHMEAQRTCGPHSSLSPGTHPSFRVRVKPPGERVMLDVILDSFGVLLLFGQAALFLAQGQIEGPPN